MSAAHIDHSTRLIVEESGDDRIAREPACGPRADCGAVLKVTTIWLFGSEVARADVKDDFWLSRCHKAGGLGVGSTFTVNQLQQRIGRLCLRRFLISGCRGIHRLWITVVRTLSALVALLTLDPGDEGNPFVGW